jgi:hypothetical protein
MNLRYENRSLSRNNRFPHFARDTYLSCVAGRRGRAGDRRRAGDRGKKREREGEGERSARERGWEMPVIGEEEREEEVEKGRNFVDDFFSIVQCERRKHPISSRISLV